MKLLLFSEVAEGLPLPGFGAAFEDHIAAKHHPRVRASSLSAWRLLEIALNEAGVHELPEVVFEKTGRPAFASFPLFFSLSHSEKLAAALLSDAPCAVDVERIRPEAAQRLHDRCLNAREKALGCDFFACWTKKECIGKLDGRGIPSRPSELDSLDAAYAGHFHVRRICDCAGQEYALAALCPGEGELHIQKIEPEELQ